ncbi:hypothetical protein ACROYT_G022334 [Oculina patagonica]
MQIFVNLLNAKKIAVEVKPLDTVETLKNTISQATGLPLSVQSLHSQNGAKIESSCRYLGDLIKPNTLIKLTYKQDASTTSFYVNAVTGTGKVLTVTPEGGNLSSVHNLRSKLSTMLDLPAESLFLRLVDMSRFVNKGLVALFDSLEECGVSSGSVLYVQIHPWKENWFHGKITRDQAEHVMSSASDGQFLIKESVNFPGDYVLFVCVEGKTKHYRVICKRNMMFTTNEREFFDSINEMVTFYQTNTGQLPIKLTEPVSRCDFTDSSADDSSLHTGEDNTLPRGRLQTNPSTEIQLRVIVGPKTFSLLTSPLNQVHTLKEQIEELSGVPAECQLLQLDGKPLVMNTFLLGDYHIMDNTTINVQVHPWNEDWYVGRMSASDVESVVKELSDAADGMFLVRESITYPGDYVLYVWYKGKSYHYRVLNKKNSFSVDNKKQFSSLPDLVEYYKHHCGSLKSQLTKPVKFDKEQRGLIPPAILARGTKAKAAYRRALDQGKTCDIRVRVMLIGKDNAGKTSVKRSLKGDKFNKDEVSTAGVQMDPPLLRVGVQPWKPVSQSDEPTTVFDHKSAQLVARQLSGGSDELEESPTKPTAKCQTDGVESSGYYVDLKKLHSQSSFQDSPPSQRREAMDERGVLIEPTSPLLQDEVFTSDSEPFGNLPQEIISLVEGILLQDHQSTVVDEIWPVIWDFAGQSLYHAIHPIFMSREAVYLLISDLSKDLFQRADTRVKQSGQSTEQREEISNRGESGLDHLMRWMDLVHSFHDPSSVEASGIAQPPVILVGTHADKVVGDPWDVMNDILNSFEGKAFSSHIVEEKFVVDNTRAGQPFQHEDENVKRLRKKILSVASTLPHTKREIPLQWLRVEKVLHRLASSGIKHITKPEFKAIANKICQFEIEEDSEELLHFLCDCGAVLYFNEADHSNSLVILDPQWLINVFCQIITVVSSKKEPMRIREHRRSLAKDGILSEELINYACQNLGLELSQDSLLSIMEKSNLICRWVVQKGKVVYFVPSMLTAKPDEEISGLIGQGSVGPIYIKFHTGYVPYGLFSRFLVLFGQYASHDLSASPPKLFANAARFFIGKKNNYNLTFACFKSVITIHLVHEGKSEDETETAAICEQVCRYVLVCDKTGHLHTHGQ